MNNDSIIESQIKYSNFMLDDIGRIFEFNGKIYRGINKNKKNLVLEMFQSGFLPELMEKGLFVKSKISELKTKEYELVVESEKIENLIYPYEWTFSMLKKAALLVIDIREIAKKYGFGMKDCHTYNIAFKGNKPIYLDLGTFIKTSNNCSPYFDFQEFFESYYYPLILWAEGLVYSVKFSFYYDARYPSIEFYLSKYKFLRNFDTNIVKRFIRFRNLINILSTVTDLELEEKIRAKGKNEIYIRLAKIIKKIVTKTKLGLYDLSRIKNEINNLKEKGTTEWEKYYGDSPKLTERFKKILFYVNTMCKDAKTAVSFGANQCFFENLLLENTHIQKVICQDIDYKALDIGFQKYTSNKDGKEMYFVCYDITRPIVPIAYAKAPYERFKSDIVFALALTHHLILKTGCSMEYIIREFRKYSNKYAFIEFMPLGLWVPGAKVNVPDWYNIENFRRTLSEYFEILLEEKLEENRILFIGKVKT
ncbi:MAG: hypothetical protein ACPLXO_02710 [Desulfurella sp.]